MPETDLPPEAALFQLLNGYRVTQILYIAARLGIADLLADGPRTAEDLAAATGAHPGALYRVLRTLASVGVFAEIAPYRFALTPPAEFLQKDRPGSSRAFALFSGEEAYRAWAEARYSVMTGAPAFEHVYGTSHFAYLAEHPEAGATFDRNMSEGSRSAAAAVVAAYCLPASIGESEARYLSDLVKVDSYRLVGADLVLNGDGGHLTMRFIAAGS